MQEAVSGEARAEAPTATDPDSTKDLLFSSTDENINQPIRPGDTIRREDLIEWSGLPVGKTCALCGGAPGRGRFVWYREKDKPGSARWVCGACYADLNGSAVEAMPPTPAATPEAVRQADDEAPAPAGTMHPELPRPGEEPAPVTPPRIRSSVPPTPIGIEGIALDIASDRGVWYVGIYRDGEKIADDASRSNPLYTKGTPTRIADRIKQAAPHFDRAAVRKATEQFFKAVTDADEPLTSDAVYRVISATERVEREMSDPPAYAVYLDNGDCLEFSNRDLAAAQPIALNERWQAIRFEPLRATQRDFGEIIDHWFSMAVPVDPPGAKSPWERIAEKLETRIAPLPRETDRSALKKYGIWQDPKPDGLLWVRSDLIQEVITEAGENPNDGRFARYLEREKILIERSKKIRVPGAGVPPRAWGLAPEFKIDIDDAPGGSLTEDPVGD